MPAPAFDALVLAAVVSELREKLIGARVQKIQQPAPHDVIFSFFGRAGAHRLLISADPQSPRMHLTQVRREALKTLPGFTQVARKDLDGAWLEDIQQPTLDRLAILKFSESELIIELMGRNANVFLLDSERRVRATLRPDTGTRGLKHGTKYVNPPAPIMGSLPTSPRIGAFAEAELEIRNIALDELLTQPFAPHSVMDSEGNTLGVWAFEPLSVLPGLRFPRESMSVALDTFYALKSERLGESDSRQKLIKALTRETDYRKKALADSRKTLEEAGRAEGYEQSGQLLLASLAQIEKGTKEITLDDWFLGETRKITLDPKKSPHENAESYFARARKARDAAEWADGRVADLEDELSELARLGEQLSTTEDLKDLEDALSEIVGAERVTPTPNEPGKKAFDGHKVKKFEIDGWTLYVGESAEANDFLLRRVAAPSDLWMHIRGAAGSHGVLRTLGHPLRVPDAVVLKAASYVAARSKLEKHARLVPVDIVERRHVRKPRGSAPGRAIYTRARTVDVSPAARE